MDVVAVAGVVPAGVEPPAVLGVHEEALAGAHVVVLGHREDLGGTVAGCGLNK